MSLPNGYKRLEYIQSTGTQYVDTGVVATANTAIHFNFSDLVLPRTGDYALLGSAWGLLSLLYSSTSAVKWYSSGNATATVSTTSINEVILTPTSIKATPPDSFATLSCNFSLSYSESELSICFLISLSLQMIV